MEEMVVVIESQRVTTERKAVIIKTTDSTVPAGRLLKKAKTVDSRPLALIVS